MDFSKLSQNNMIAAGGGLLALIALFLPWYGSNTGTIFDISINGWSSSLWAWGGCLLAFAAGTMIALKALEVYETKVAGMETEQFAMVLGGVGAVFVLLRFLTATSGTKFGLYLGIIAAIAAAAGSFLSAKDKGIGLPTADSFKGGSGGGGTDGGTPSEF